MTATARSTRRALVLGALTVGTLDILDAIIFFGLRGVKPIRIPQSIASGLLGRSAFQGGVPAAALGLLLHYTIATMIVLVFWTASRRLPSLTERPFVWGPPYGVAVYIVMNYVVIPLSATAGGSHALPVVTNGVLIHIFGVGIPSALAARAARGEARAAAFAPATG